MKIEMMKVSDLVPYENNPRDNSKAVPKVAESLKEFGWQQPIVIDKDKVVIAGHTRLEAAKSLGMDSVPCVVASDLTPDQVRAYRLADNKTGELAGWDFILLDSELKELGDIDMELFGFNLQEDEEYNDFVEKFEIKKTTDDCYTPKLIYDAVADWVANEYELKRENFVRPFKPGGDYQAEKYKPGDVVVDNPPFSIMREIIQFYTEHRVKFFLFAPALAIFNYVDRCTAISLQAKVEYENGAKVPTSFLTNLEGGGVVARTSPSLYEAVDKANTETIKEKRRELPNYDYPDNIVTAAMMGKFSKYGIELVIRDKQCKIIRELDEQKAAGKGIYGAGLILSEKAAAEKAAAEKAAAEKAAAEKAAAEKAAAEKAAATTWKLSDRERAIIKELSKYD